MLKKDLECKDNSESCSDQDHSHDDMQELRRPIS